MPEKLFRILLTSAGTSTALGVIKGLRDDERFEIHSTDVNPKEMLPIGAFKLGSHTQVSYATDKNEFIKEIENIVVSKSIDCIYPIHDEEIRVIASTSSDIIKKRRSKFSHVDIINCTDKLLASNICKANGIDSPKTATLVDFLNDPFYPAFTKPRIGVGSIGAKKVENASDLLSEGNSIVVQEVCASPEITVDALAWNDKVIAVARERLEIKAGVSTKARVFYSDELELIASKISTAFKLNGIFCFQVMMGHRGWVVIDINPRSGGATAMTLSAGINLFKEHFLIEAGHGNEGRFAEIIDQARKLKSRIIVRYFDEHVSYIEG